MDRFRVRWTDRIHEEWIGNLIKNGGNPEKLARTRRLMDQAVPDCLITDYESLIDDLSLPDPDDRHVLAAAIVGKVDVIVTANLGDFPREVLDPYNIEAQHPDDFVMYQFDLHPWVYCKAIKDQRARLQNPPLSVDEFIQLFAKLQMPQTVARLKSFDSAI